MKLVLFLLLLVCLQSILCDQVIIETPLGHVRGFEAWYVIYITISIVWFVRNKLQNIGCLNQKLLLANYCFCNTASLKQLKVENQKWSAEIP